MKDIHDILVASDLGHFSEVVVRSAAALAALTNARLHVLHIQEFHPLPYMEFVPAMMLTDEAGRLQEALQEQVERTVGPGVEVASTDVVLDAPPRAILNYAEKVDADLIVIGRHRPGGIADRFLGGTADSVVRAAQVPVLIIGRAFEAPLRRVLVPVDLSEPAVHALDIALRWVLSIRPEDTTPEIIVLHVIPRVFDYRKLPLDDAAISGSLNDAIQAALARAQAPTSLHTAGVVRSADDPAEEIRSFIDEENVDLAVLGTHGYGAFKRALIGSVSSKVARAAACPVLLVPPALAPEG